MKTLLTLVFLVPMLCSCSLIVQPSIDYIPCEYRSDGTDPCPDGMRCNPNPDGIGRSCELTRRTSPLVAP